MAHNSIATYMRISECVLFPPLCRLQPLVSCLHPVLTALKEMPQENITWQSDSAYLSLSDFHTYLDNIFLIVELSEVSLSDYFEITVYEDIGVDA